MMGEGPDKEFEPMRTKTNRVAAAILSAAVAAAAAEGMTPALAAPAVTPSTPAPSRDAAARAQAVLDRSVDYLKSQQKPDGGWQGEKDPPAATALVLKAIAGARPQDRNSAYLKKGYDKLLSYQLDNGGIYKDLLANYNTSIAVSALAAAEKPEFKERIDRAVAYLKGLQWTPETRPEFADGKEQFTGKQVVKDEKDPFFGGTGYGGRSRGAGGGRPDLSNTQLTLEALRDAGLKPDDPAFQNALKFVTRMQNLSETNDRPWAGDDGGFVYSPADNRMGESMAGEYVSPDGKRMLRSYGSMTYAGLKSMIYAGLTKDDPRVKAAWDWVSKNWTLDENPGMRLNDPKVAQNGLYYYYHTLARALNAYDQPVITDPQGNPHDWRVELVDKLAGLQKPNGSWAGEKKWMEDNPVLVTAYVAIALQETIEDLKQHPPK
jgi:squalene-hopene/tetraprenyl-beta-curcumene cyclase